MARLSKRGGTTHIRNADGTITVKGAHGEFQGKIAAPTDPTAGAGPAPDHASLNDDQPVDVMAEAERQLAAQYARLNPKAAETTQSENPGEGTETRQCPACGRFVGTNAPHTCAKLAFLHAAPVIRAVYLGGVAMGALALGPVVTGIVGSLVAVGYVAGRFLRRYAERKALEGIHNTPPQMETTKTQTYVDDLAKKMNVEGPVKVFYAEKKEAKVLGDKDFANAGAICSPGGTNQTIIVGDAFLDLPEKHQQAILAHEMAHLQKKGRHLHHFVRSAGTPIGFAGGALAIVGGGAGAVVAGAAVGAAWLGGVLVSNALSRREERRADRAAYEMHGENFVDALEDTHSVKPGLVRGDLPWRGEDVLCTHGNLPNRIKDLRK